MTSAYSMFPDLMAECDARGIRLSIDGYGGLTIDAPQHAMTPGLVEQLKAHKPALLAALRSMQVAVTEAQAEHDASQAVQRQAGQRHTAQALWRATLDSLAGDPEWPPDMVNTLRLAAVQWGDDGRET